MNLVQVEQMTSSSVTWGCSLFVPRPRGCETAIKVGQLMHVLAQVDVSRMRTRAARLPRKWLQDTHTSVICQVHVVHVLQLSQATKPRRISTQLHEQWAKPTRRPPAVAPRGE